MTISTKELIKLADMLRDHFIHLGFPTTWNFYGNDVIVDIVTNTEARKRAEDVNLPPEEWGKDSTSITIWVEGDTWSMFINHDAKDRIDSPTEEDIKGIIERVEKMIF